MKHLILFSLIISASAFASKEVIYGNDDRLDVFESKDSALVELARSTAGMVNPTNLEEQKGQTLIKGKSLEKRGICPTERFARQISGPVCSGFIVSDTLLVTAGHCIKNDLDCKNFKWVFDYKVSSADQIDVTVPSTNVYGCSKVISRALGTADQNDYALIQLDRKVTDRRPLSFRRSGKISVGESLVLIGHPSGLPTKIADGANVRSLSDKFFVANTDSYGGNSGSAVFNANTHEVEGILVRGETDYVTGPNYCKVSNRCENAGCRGEDITYITNIAELKKLP